ncbi:MAG TPA: PilZ domain-containing protein [Myxococcota bacterium]|nr:PilZ domain-containing protein [Myxococcota bacterium]
MSERELVLILGPEERTRILAGRVLLMNYRSTRAEDLEGALRAQNATPLSIRTALISTDHRLPDVRQALRDLADGAPRGGIQWIAYGRRPEPDQVAALREAGVSLALFEPFTDEELRFVINEAHHVGRDEPPRIEERVPSNLRARVVTKTGERAALVYNISAGGAYLVTPRPALRGGPVEVFLTLPGGETVLHGRVMWNNVPGNLRRPNAPVGMGVRFDEVPPDALAGLLTYVEERARAYRL